MGQSDLIPLIANSVHKTSVRQLYPVMKQATSPSNRSLSLLESLSYLRRDLLVDVDSPWSFGVGLVDVSRLGRSSVVTPDVKGNLEAGDGV